ncbi:hypothetical protein AB0333_02035 [Citricoccus sp. NPDC079358]|uniref:Uncharacterized protein n=1 Tax=Citricoccus muralis TaxID=169134 RepID=A0A3D9LEN1_9MICC|nr:hypothetical protein [Citricoccus muralis]REE03603.1 hypothetical protein C8E99_1416 [Citricoccus muralis]
MEIRLPDDCGNAPRIGIVNDGKVAEVRAYFVEMASEIAVEMAVESAEGTA